jgi:hypothetical protein
VALPLDIDIGVVPTASSAVDAGAMRGPQDSADLTLEVLMRQALEVPGAATALLQAFAAQSRALRLVQEADARGAASLPTELRHRLAAVAARTPAWLASEGGAGVRA